MRYIGGKTQLLKNIEYVIDENTDNCNTFCDIFSGTGAVAKHFKPKYEVYSNDILHFSYVLQKATIENNIKPSFSRLSKTGINNPIDYLEENSNNSTIGNGSFISNNYAPNDNCERMYITEQNAKRLDFIRITIEKWKNEKLLDEIEYYYLLASLIEGVPYISNIAGTYGAYLKKWDKRALNDFNMVRFDVIDNGLKNLSYNKDANELIKDIEGNILYIDPPYNSRQYAPNYHLLETISRYDNPEIKGVTGLRNYDDIKSAFCVKGEVLSAFEHLVENAKFSNIVMSYSSDGLMSSQQIETTLKQHGIADSFKKYDIPYRKYKSKIYDEDKAVKEYIFFIKKNIPKREFFYIQKQEAISENIKSNRGKYIKSPLNYIGGKYKLLPQLLPLFPSEIGTFVDLFSGGCNVAININAKKIICNDINTKIIDMYSVFQNTATNTILDSIAKNIENFSLSKENEQGFLQFRKYYNTTQNPIDLYTLSCYSFNYQFRFNNKLEYNNPFGRNRSQFSANMKNNLLLFLDFIKNNNIVFTANDFTSVDFSGLGENDFVYCDPPYLITTGSYNDGNRGFKDWSEKEEEKLYTLLDNLHIQGVKFALSNVLIHKGVRNKMLIDWSKRYVVSNLKNNYSNSSYNTVKGESAEILITNY